MPVPSSFYPFVIVGAIGFLVDSGIVTFLVTVLDWNPYSGRILSFIFAIFVTWLLNRHWGFRQRRSEMKRREFGRYMGAQTIGAGINYGIYSAMLMAYPLLKTWPVIPVAIGSLVAMLFNYIALHFFVFVKE